MNFSRHRTMASLIVVNLLWAAQYPAYKVASERMSPSALNFWTLLFAVLLLLPFLWRGADEPSAAIPSASPAKTLFQYGLLGMLGIVPPSVFMAWGIARSTASNASILSLTIPVLMTVLGVLLLREKLTWLRIASLLMALGGTVVISWSDFSGDLLDTRLLAGNSVILLAGMGSAFYNTYSKVLLARHRELKVLVYSYLVGTLCCLVISLVADKTPLWNVSDLPLSVWLAILVLGSLSWGTAMVLWMWVLKRLDASQASVSIYMLSVFGVALSAITLRERPGISQVAGGLLVLAATYLVSEYESRRLKTALVEPNSGVPPTDA